MNRPEDEPLSTESSLHRVAACWDRTTQSRRESTVRGWLDSYPVASERLNAPVSGSPHVNWLIGLARRLDVPASSRWLSIGCGSAGQEIIAAESGLFARLDALDISPVALDEGRRAAEAKGIDNISFREADFHELEVAPESYDVILMNMSLHHVEELETLLGRVREAMRPNAFFLINEYVGPRQFQFSDLQLSIVRDLLEALPEQLRLDVTTGEVKREYVRRPVEFWNMVDPSESIRSDEIVPLLEHFFQVVERIDYGGTVLHLLLEHVIHNFDNGNEDHMALLRLLGKVEDVLISQGVLTSDFTVMALARKEAALSPKGVPRSGSDGPTASSLRADVEFLSRELAQARSYIHQIESSRGWRLVERIRGLFGLGWRAH